MKKMLCVGLAALMLLACAGCGSEPEKTAAFSAEETTRALLDSGAYSETLEELETDIAVMMFWLSGDAAQYEGSKVYYSTGATCEAAAVICVQDETLVPEVEQALNDWVQSQIEAEKDYRPAEVPKLENAIIEARGNSVLLVVAADGEKASEAIEQISK